MSYATVVQASKWKVIDATIVTFPLGEGLVTINFPSAEKMKAFALEVLDAASGKNVADLLSALTLNETETEEEIQDTSNEEEAEEEAAEAEEAADDASVFVDPVVAADEERALFGDISYATEAEDAFDVDAGLPDGGNDGNDGNADEDQAAADDSSDDSFEYEGGVSQELYRPSYRSTRRRRY